MEASVRPNTGGCRGRGGASQEDEPENAPGRVLPSQEDESFQPSREGGGGTPSPPPQAKMSPESCAGEGGGPPLPIAKMSPRSLTERGQVK